jgi:glycosyltransferase involved in cell wall biosynthesis
MSVLYIVGKNVPTSIPLDVAGAIVEKKIDLTVAAFNKTNGNEKHFTSEVVPLKARSCFDPQGITNLYRCILESEPEIIHVHHTASAFWGAILAKLVAGAAVIRTEHNNQQHYSLPQNILHGSSQLLADRVLCNSKDTYRNLYPLQKWAIGDSWKVVYNGINVSRIDAALNRELPVCIQEIEDRVLIGSVGRLVDQKNYQQLINAFSSVLAEVPEAHLVLIGDGENRSQLEREAVAQGIEDRITFLGECPRADVYAALHAFDLFVMPSLWEGFCNAVVEAMAVGLPIVCSDISTLREVVGDAAHYADPNDPADMARALVELLKMGSSVRKQWGEKARKRAAERYTIEDTAEKYVETYRKVTRQRSA